MKHSKMSEALAHLNQLIGLGAEYPDAEYDTSVAFELTTQDVVMLRMRYDEQCAAGQYQYTAQGDRELCGLNKHCVNCL